MWSSAVVDISMSTVACRAYLICFSAGHGCKEGLSELQHSLDFLIRPLLSISYSAGKIAITIFIVVFSTILCKH